MKNPHVFANKDELREWLSYFGVADMGETAVQSVDHVAEVLWDHGYKRPYALYGMTPDELFRIGVHSKPMCNLVCNLVALAQQIEAEATRRMLRSIPWKPEEEEEEEDSDNEEDDDQNSVSSASDFAEYAFDDGQQLVYNMKTGKTFWWKRHRHTDDNETKELWPDKHAREAIREFLATQPFRRFFSPEPDAPTPAQLWEVKNNRYDLTWMRRDLRPAYEKLLRDIDPDCPTPDYRRPLESLRAAEERMNPELRQRKIRELEGHSPPYIPYHLRDLYEELHPDWTPDYTPWTPESSPGSEDASDGPYSPSSPPQTPEWLRRFRRSPTPDSPEYFEDCPKSPYSPGYLTSPEY